MQTEVLKQLKMIYICLSIAAAIQVIPGVWDGVIHLTQPPDAFFTPLHMIIYGGAAFGIVTTVAGFFFLLDNYEYRNENEMWGIKLALVATVLWLFGGSFDYWWHQTLTQESFLIFHFVTPSHVVIEFAIGFFIAAGFIGYSWLTKNLVCRKLAPYFGRSWKFINDAKLISSCISSAESLLPVQEDEIYRHVAAQKALPMMRNTSTKENRVTSDRLRKRISNLIRSTLPVLTFALILLSSVLFTYTASGIDITVGTNPAGVAVNPNTNTIYVANQGDNTISVIDGATNTVVDTIPAGANSNGVAVNPNTNTIYVANQGDNTISVIDGATNTVVDTIPVGVSPFQVSVNPSTNTVYVPNLFSNTVSVIDGATNTVVDTISVGIGPGAVVVNTNTNMMYVPNIFSDEVSVIDGATNTVVATISVGGGPVAGVVNPTTNRLYIVGLFSNTVSVIDITPSSPTENTVVNTLTVGASHFGASVSFNPNTNRIFVADHNSDTLSVIDTLTETVLGAVPVGSGPAGSDVNPNTNIVYVTNQNSNTVSVIDFSANISPVANAGPDQSVNEGVQVTLDGTSSSDIDGNTLTFSWTQTAGPFVTLSDANVANPTFTAPFVTSTTVLTFELVVNDGTVDSAPDSVNVVVNDVSTFLVELVEQPSGVLAGGVDVGDVAAGTTITLEFFETPPGALPFAELQQKTIPIGVDGNDVSFDFIVDSVVPSDLPPPPLETDIFFDVSFTGIDFSNPSSFIQNQTPSSRYLVDRNVPSDQRFPDQCPVEFIALLNENAGQWELLGDPLQPNTNKIYTANQDSNTVSVIDGTTNTLITTIPVGANPNGIDFDPNTNKIYVANQGSDTVTVIDGSTDTVVNTIIGVGGQPFKLDINPNTNMIYVTNFGTNVVSVIDGSTNTVVAVIPVGVGPAGVAVNSNTNKIYIANFFSMTVSVIDGSTNTMVATVPLTDNPSLIEVNPDTNKVYVTNFLSNTVTVIDGSTDTVVTSITVGAAPTGLAVNRSTNKIYVANTGSDTVSVIDGLADAVVATIIVAPGVSTVDLNENTNRVFVGQSTSSTVFVIDGFANTVKASVNLGVGGFGEFAVNSAIPNPVRDSFADVIDQSTGEILQCGYLAQLPHLSKFSGGRPIRATSTGGGGSGVYHGRDFAFGDPNSPRYDGEAPDIEQVLIQSGSLKVLARVTDTVGVKDVNVIMGKKVFAMEPHEGSQGWWELVIPSADLPSSGTVLLKIVARDYNNNTSEYPVSANVPVGAFSSTSTEGSSFVITPLPIIGQQTDQSYSIIASGVRPSDQNISPQITIKNTGSEPLQNIRLMLSPELKGKFLLSENAIKNIEPQSEYTISLKLNGKANVDAMNNPIPYSGNVIISVDNHTPYILEIVGNIPNESASLQSLFMNMISSKAENRYKSFEKPDLRISQDTDYKITLGSGASMIKGSDELIITNTSDKPLKNLRIMTSSVSEYIMPDQKNIELLPAGSFVKVKLVSKLNGAASARDLQGEIIVAPENARPLSVPINIGKQLLKDKNEMYEVTSVSGSDTITHTSDSIVIKNNSEESIDNIRIILPQELARVFSLSEDSFKSIEPNGERTIHIKLRGTVDSSVKQILNEYSGDIIIVSSDGMKKIMPVNISWKGISSEHFVINARDNAEELTKAALVINFLERSYHEVTKIVGKAEAKTVMYMTSSLDEVKMLNNALAPSTYVYDDDVGFVWSNSEDVNILALKEFTYRTIMQNYGTYWVKQKISADKGNWLVDGISTYVTASIAGERGMIRSNLEAFVAEPASFEWYGAPTPSQNGASYTLFKFLAEKYGESIIDRTLSQLGSTMVSNNKCDTIEQCALLMAVYDANGWSINDKRHDLSFATIIEEWVEHVEEDYALRMN